jgi:hypothetical protein
MKRFSLDDHAVKAKEKHQCQKEELDEKLTSSNQCHSEYISEYSNDGITPSW